MDQRAWLGIVVLALVSALPSVARADVVPDIGPRTCPPPKVLVTRHGGRHCRDPYPPAPKDCPAGWLGTTGEQGARCVLNVCTPASAHLCPKGETCVETSVCYETQMQRWGAASLASPLLAAPPPAPHPVDVVVDVCSSGAACDAPAFCKSTGVCLKPGQSAAKNPKRPPFAGIERDAGSEPQRAPVTAPTPTVPPATTASTPPVEPPSAADAAAPPNQPEPVPPKSGCGGCAAGDAAPSGVVLVGAAIAAAALLRGRKKR